MHFNYSIKVSYRIVHWRQLLSHTHFLNPYYFDEHAYMRIYTSH